MKKLAFVFLAGLILSSCSSLKVTTDLDKSVNFEEYKTLEYWGWSDDSDKILNRFDKERIEKAFADEFRKRGIEVVEKGKGDMIVSLFILTEQKTEKTATTTGSGGYGGYYGYGPGYGWGGGYSTTTINEYEYIDGTLVISCYDAEKKQLIWEAIGKKTIDEDPKKREANTAKNISYIMKDYPVQPKQ
jgi:hypothetical protein